MSHTQKYNTFALPLLIQGSGFLRCLDLSYPSIKMSQNVIKWESLPGNQKDAGLNVKDSD